MKANLTPETARRVGIEPAPGRSETPKLRARVFIVQQDDTRDYSDATRFGRLVPLIEGPGFPDNSQDRVWAAQKIMRLKMKDFDRFKDHLLLSGDPVWIALAIFVLSTYTDRIQLLKWDRQTRMYYPVVLTEQRATLKELEEKDGHRTPRA